MYMLLLRTRMHCECIEKTVRENGGDSRRRTGRRRSASYFRWSSVQSLRAAVAYSSVKNPER